MAQMSDYFFIYLTLRIFYHFLNTASYIFPVKWLSHVRLFATPWTLAYHAPLSIGFSRQEYWSGLPFPSPGDRPNPGIESRSPTLQVDSLLSEPPGKPIKVIFYINYKITLLSVSSAFS